MYQSTWMEQLMRLYLKPGHYALYSYILTNEISHCKQTEVQPHVFHILESEECKQWAIKLIPRSQHGLTLDQNYGRAIGQCGNKTYIKSLIENKSEPHGSLIYNILRGLFRGKSLETIQWFMSIMPFPALFDSVLIDIARQYQRPDALRIGMTLTSPHYEYLLFSMACNIVIDNHDLSWLEILRRDRLWDAMSVFQYAASNKNQFIFTWLYKTCPLETYDDLIRQYPYISDWFNVM
jgi:hypothetical protein